MIRKAPIHILFFLILLLFASGVKAQFHEYSGAAEFQGIFSSRSENPFWFHSNKRGRVDEGTGMAGWIYASGKYYIHPEATLEVGTGLSFRDGYLHHLRLDEFYMQFENYWVRATAGSKQREELYRGLSATNENILWSLNARPMPGLRLELLRPVEFWEEADLGFIASLEEYSMENDRYVQNARVHHKSFHLVYSGFSNLEIRLGMQHFAQWGGTSAEYGVLPGGFSDYLTVISGSGLSGNDHGGVSEQEVNALGNHLGSYEVNLKTTFQNYDIELLWNHIFEDASGLRLGNTPDGRYGIYISDTEDLGVIHAVMYEFYYTKDQSDGSSNTDGLDNYLNNNLYRSGWTHYRQVLGVPFFTLNDNRFRIGNNRFIAHHLGIRGNAFHKIPFKLLTSYRKNYGVKSFNFPETLNVFSTYLDVFLWESTFELHLQVGGDFSPSASPNHGFGFRFKRDLF